MLPAPNVTLSVLKFAGVTQQILADRYDTKQEYVSMIIYSPTRKRRPGSKAFLIATDIKRIIDNNLHKIARKAA